MIIEDTQQEFFDRRLQWLETLFRPLSTKKVQWFNTHDGHSGIINDEDYPLVRDNKIWREREPKSGRFYFRMNNPSPSNGHGPRPEVHRLIVGVTDPKIHVKFDNGNPFDLRRENLLIT
jgi:hypothetical protein